MMHCRSSPPRVPVNFFFKQCSKCTGPCAVSRDKVDRPPLCNECIGACVRQVCSSLPLHDDRPSHSQEVVGESGQKGIGSAVDHIEPVYTRETSNLRISDFGAGLAFSEVDSREGSMSSINSTDSASSTALQAFQSACDYFSELSSRRIPKQA